MPHSILALQNVSLIRNNQQGITATILHDFSYIFPHEQISAIIGASGSGKSSLLRLINRLDEPSACTILFRDKNIATLSPLLLRQQIGMVMQKSFMFEGTVLENLQRPFLYRNSKPPTANSQEIARVLELAQLPEALLLRDAQSLSGGEQQRLNLARTLLTKPHVLLLDEPTNALDRPAITRLATILHTLCRTEQLTIIIVTHDLYFAEICSHQLLYIEKGCLREDGATAEMLAFPKTTAFASFLATPEKQKENYP